MEEVSNVSPYSVDTDELIVESFERLGISGDQITSSQLMSAKRSLNLLLLSWMTKSLNLWTLKVGSISLVPNVSNYSVPENINDIELANLIDYSILTNTNSTSEVAQSNTLSSYDGLGGGTANLAFDDNLNTYCAQTSINGNISYDFGVNNEQTVTFVGIFSNQAIRYNLVIESGVLDSDNDMIMWTELFKVGSQEYSVNIGKWINIPVPISARYYRIRETGGQTLNISEIYFTNNKCSYQLGKLGRDEYLSLFIRETTGRPSAFYFDKQIKPSINIWMVPDSTYKLIEYSASENINPTSGYVDISQVPAKMLPALCSGLTHSLAIKFNPNLTEIAKAEYEEAFSVATMNDVENVPLTINYDLSKYYEHR